MLLLLLWDAGTIILQETIELWSAYSLTIMGNGCHGDNGGSNASRLCRLLAFLGFLVGRLDTCFDLSVPLITFAEYLQ